jgi:hypothetical protein
MAQHELTALLGLLAVALLAAGATAFMLRVGTQLTGQQRELVPGYPPALFPVRELTRSGPLAVLAETQGRLLSVYHQLPPSSDSAIWLRTFLIELRAIMDSAYQVSATTAAYSHLALLDLLVAEVTLIEEQVVREVANNLLHVEGDRSSELLAGRIATLRMCARELNLSAH